MRYTVTHDVTFVTTSRPDRRRPTSTRPATASSPSAGGAPRSPTSPAAPGVSRMTIYRRWPDMRPLLADLMTREWAAPSPTRRRTADARHRRPGRRRPSARAARQPAVPPDRRGRPRAAAAVPARPARPQPGRHPRPARARRSRDGQADGSVRAGDPALLARSLLLAAHGFVLSRRTRWPTTSVTEEPTSTTELRALRPRAGDLAAMTPHCRDAGPASWPTRRRHRVDVLVVGLGVTGAGVALDAASRGLTALAVDAHDLAFGTSRWSSKLVHGGLRYLANGQVGVAHESAVERGILMDGTAPHLTRPLPMLLPLMSSVVPRPGRPDPRSACAPATPCASRAAPRRRTLPRAPPRVGAPRRCRLAPGAAPRRPARRPRCRGTASSRTTPGWWSRSPGPRPRTAPASSPAPGSPPPRATRVDLRDELTGATRTVRAGRSSTRPACGPATSPPTSRCAPPAAPTSCCAPTPCPASPSAVTAPVPGETNRFVFALPQPDGPVYVGLTDEPVDGPTARRAGAERGRDRVPARRARRRPSRRRCAARTWSAPSPGCARCSTPARDAPPTSPAGTPC